MKNLMKKAGYISIELVIVAGIVLVVGIVAITTFTQKGRTAANAANDKINKAFLDSEVTTA